MLRSSGARDGDFAAHLTQARRSEAQAHQLAREIRTLTQWLSHDILALTGPPLATREALFDFVVALQNQRDDLLAFAGVLDEKLAAIAQTTNV